MVCFSIAMQSSNQNCNAFQASVGIFLHTANTADVVIDFLHKIGISINTKSVQLAVGSLSLKRDRSARQSGGTGEMLISWDNIDINFPRSTPTADKSEETLVHMTAATMMPLHPDTKTEDLNCARQVWERSGNYNPAIHSQSIHPGPVPDERRGLPSSSASAPETSNVYMGPPLPSTAGSERRGPSDQPAAPSAAFRNPSLRDLLLVHAETGLAHSSGGLLRRDRFNAWKFLVDLVENGPRYFAQFRKDIDRPETVEEIPLVKTQQVPLHAMDINPNTPATNGEVLDNIFSQVGVGQEAGRNLHDPGNRVILVSGDLLTGERLRSLMRSRSEESSSWRRLENVIFVMGLFHFKMACADAVWRTFIQPKDAKGEPNCLIEQVGQIRPKETGKVKSSPGFRRMHEIIQHVGICLRLESWLAKVKTLKGVSSLEEWAEIYEPTLDDLIALSNELARDYVSSPSALSTNEAQGQAADAYRDLQYENMLLQQQMFLLYEESSYSMNMGDIGRLETTFLPWAFIFQSCGKHKYASELLRYMKNVFFVYPPGLRWVSNILTNKRSYSLFTYWDSGILERPFGTTSLSILPGNAANGGELTGSSNIIICISRCANDHLNWCFEC